MKKFTLKIKVFLLLLLAVAETANAQTTEPLVAEGKRWNVVLRDVWEPPQPQRFTTYCYKLEGDTVLDEISYKLLHYTLYEDLSHFSYRAALREEPDGKVFCRHSSSSDEILLYDFSLQPNDSISIDGHEYLVLDDIRDTIIGDVSRKKFTFFYSNHTYEKEIWIEGIGSEYGLLNPGALAFPGGMTYLLCSYENERLVWQNTDFNTCFYTNWDYDLVGEEKDDGIGVYPNPTKGNITITGENLSKIEVFNIVRQTIISSDCEGSSATIDMSGLPAGVYFFNITDSNGKKCTKKVVKE